MWRGGHQKCWRPDSLQGPQTILLLLGSQGVASTGDRTKTLPSWSLHSDGKFHKEKVNVMVTARGGEELLQVVREGLSEEVTFEQRPE